MYISMVLIQYNSHLIHTTILLCAPSPFNSYHFYFAFFFWFGVKILSVKLNTSCACFRLKAYQEKGNIIPFEPMQGFYCEESKVLIR